MTTTSSAGAIGPHHVCIPHFRFLEIATTPGAEGAGNKARCEGAGSGQDGATLPIISTLPEGCLIVTVRGRHLEPLVRDGEQVAVDFTDTIPVEDAFYLRRLRSAYGDGFQMDVLAARLERLKSNPDGSWFLGPRRRPGRIDGCDGPYSAQRFRETLLGRVVVIVVGCASEPAPTAPEAVAPWPSGDYIGVAL